ncbi:MAG: regulatory protein RecX [SAR202 cluster bacterium]|nr:regulatory protein RecX [SAR202 cluster bacterium]MDP6299752.1 regulatory protein RecX [SAR202 cluster bacterium]MDP7102298.1 regulatory protein RecX [SAR202 cluster bacterium]MDP7224954.1 regulatory protein RecX [SAR202 cluster bacterium]MDP7414178.1 regulatory protein RecX [SAR202 cluster bacterium]
MANSNDPSRQKARDRALCLLAHRPRSESELRTRLNRDFSPETVDGVLATLRDQSLVNDAEFARLWTESRNRQRPRSATALRRELLSKGISQSLADSAVDDVDDEESAHRAGAKFARRLTDADFDSFNRKLAGHLQRRGYGYAQTRQTVSALWDELHSDDDSSESVDID